jgi:hypothetical protein
MHNTNEPETVKPELRTAAGGPAKVPDGLYRGKGDRYLFIKEGIFHFPLTMLDPERVLLGGFPILQIRDLHADCWRFFVRASHCVELYPASAADLKTIVARYGAKL